MCIKTDRKSQKTYIKWRLEVLRRDYKKQHKVSRTIVTLCELSPPLYAASDCKKQHKVSRTSVTLCELFPPLYAASDYKEQHKVRGTMHIK